MHYIHARLVSSRPRRRMNMEVQENIEGGLQCTGLPLGICEEPHRWDPLPGTSNSETLANSRCVFFNFD